MYYALPIDDTQPVHVNEVNDLNKRFKCLNSECSAEFVVCSSDGIISKHFRRRKSTPHIPNCIYGSLTAESISPENVIKDDLNNIYCKNTQRSNSIHKSTSSKKTTGDKSDISYIRTPKQLLKYCLYNDIDAVYKDNIRVKDIIVDNRTIFFNDYYKGFNGLKFILGNVKRYNTDSIVFEAKVTTSKGKNILLTATVFMGEALRKKIIKYLFETNEVLSNSQIAVFGEWKKTSEYNVKCNLNLEKNILYRF